MVKGTTLHKRYVIEKVFADSGGMGIIYAAHDRKCANNQVLIKTTRYDGGDNARYFRYTQDEAVKHVEKLRKIIAWEKKSSCVFVTLNSTTSPRSMITSLAQASSSTLTTRVNEVDTRCPPLCSRQNPIW